MKCCYECELWKDRFSYTDKEKKNEEIISSHCDICDFLDLIILLFFFFMGKEYNWEDEVC